MVNREEIGIIGVGSMGSNLAANFVDNDFTVHLFDIDIKKAALVANRIHHPNLSSYGSLREFSNAFSARKVLLLMIPAGSYIDDLLKSLNPYLEVGDIIIDGGNSYYEDTERRFKELYKEGIEFVGMGISGGMRGARNGASLMIGSSMKAWQDIKGILQHIAAKRETIPCIAWFGPGGSGHFVKMVHNGIEYAVMEVISECYDLLKSFFGDNDEISDIFYKWNDGNLRSFLIEITADIVSKKEGSTVLIDVISDQASQKGTGILTSLFALKSGISVSGITEAVFQRMNSEKKEERKKLSQYYNIHQGSAIKLKLEKIERGLYCSIILAYLQGLRLIALVSKENQWNISLSDLIHSWRNGSILQAEILDKFHSIFSKTNERNVFFIPDIISMIKERLEDLSYIVQTMVTACIPSPTMSSLFNFILSITSSFLPTNLVQAQRDYFGNHGFYRVDIEGVHHIQKVESRINEDLE